MANYYTDPTSFGQSSLSDMSFAEYGDAMLGRNLQWPSQLIRLGDPYYPLADLDCNPTVPAPKESKPHKTRTTIDDRRCKDIWMTLVEHPDWTHQMVASSMHGQDM